MESVPTTGVWSFGPGLSLIEEPFGWWMTQPLQEAQNSHEFRWLVTVWHQGNVSFRIWLMMTHDGSFVLYSLFCIHIDRNHIPVCKSITFWCDLVCRLCIIGWTAKNSLSIQKQSGMLLCQISDAGPKASEQLTATMAKMHEPQEEHGKTGTLMDIGHGKSWKRMCEVKEIQDFHIQRECCFSILW